MVVSIGSKVKVYYNDTENHVTCSEGEFISWDAISISIRNGDREISISNSKIVRVEER